MAVEIKEIVIKAVIANGDHSDSSGVQPQADQDAMVQECVNQVLKVLQKKNRR